MICVLIRCEVENCLYSLLHKKLNAVARGQALRH